MSRVYGDPVDVWTSDQGRPVRFVWRGRLFTVHRILEHWVATRDWWRELHPELEDAREREFWRVEASPGGPVGVYELRFDAATDAWMLSRAWD